MRNLTLLEKQLIKDIGRRDAIKDKTLFRNTVLKGKTPLGSYSNALSYLDMMGYIAEQNGAYFLTYKGEAVLEEITRSQTR